jgi:hypothetical protein
VTLARPLHCVILGIDPGERSGVALMDCGELCWVDIATTQLDREQLTLEAGDVATVARLPLIIAAERWTPHGRWGPKQLQGMGAQWGKWLAAIEELPRMKPTVKIVRFTPQEWRSAIFGRRQQNHNRETWDRMTTAYAQAKWPEFTFDRDSSVAACIALVAAHSERVAKLPGVR